MNLKKIRELEGQFDFRPLALTYSKPKPEPKGLIELMRKYENAKRYFLQVVRTKPTSMECDRALDVYMEASDAYHSARDGK